MNKSIFFIFMICLSFPFNSFAGMFKCTDPIGKVTFQATPCTGGSKEAQVQYNKKRGSSTQCLPKCKSKYMVCLGNQGSSKTRDEGMALCKKTKKACEVSCSDPTKGEEMIKRAEYERKLFEADKKYEKRMRQYEREKAQQRESFKNEVRSYGCNWYKNRLSKAKKAWKAKKKDGYTPHDKKRYEGWIDRAQQDVNYVCK